MFDQLDSFTQTTIQAKVEYFEDIAVITEDIVQKTWELYNDIKVSINSKNFSNKIIVGKKIFLELYEKNGKNVKWFNQLNEYRLQPISQEFYNAYINGKHWNCDFKDRSGDLDAIIQNGNYHLLIIDKTSYNNLIYDKDKKPINRAYFIDYIFGGFNGKDKKLQPLFELLNNHPQCKEVEIIDIPYYNADYYGQKAIQFLFYPNDEQFNKLVKNDTFTGIKKIKKWLNIRKSNEN